MRYISLKNYYLLKYMKEFCVLYKFVLVLLCSNTLHVPYINILTRGSWDLEVILGQNRLTCCSLVPGFCDGYS